jgi:glycosyltransferase involved in cell wall biosynthesis
VRLLYFTRGYTPHDVRFLERLSREDLEVGYLALESGAGPIDSRPLPPGVRRLDWPDPVTRFTWAAVPRLVRGLRRITSTFRPDVVHAGPVQQSAFIAAAAGVRPLVTMSWGSDLLMEARRGPGKWAARFTLARSTLFLCDCQTVRRAAGALGMPAERSIVFPWGVDLARFSHGRAARLRRRLGWQKATVLLSARAWEPLYGVDTLLDGFVQAAARRPDLRLLLLGDGSLRPRLLATIAAAGMQDRIHIAGRVDEMDLPGYFREADVYVTASHSDGSSVTLLQAMACGLPAIASDIPSNAEWVEDGTGWRFRDGDAADLAGVILAASASPAAMRQRGRGARQAAVARADWERNTSMLPDVYRYALHLEQA